MSLGTSFRGRGMLTRKFLVSSTRGREWPQRSERRVRNREATHFPGNQRILLSRYAGQSVQTEEMDDPAESHAILSPLSFMRCLDKLCSVSTFTIATQMERDRRQEPPATCFEPLRLHMSATGLECLKLSCNPDAGHSRRGNLFLKGYQHWTKECKWQVLCWRAL